MSAVSDTSADVEARQFALLRAMTVAERAELLDALCTDVTELAVAGIRLEYPCASAEEIRRHLLIRRYGSDFVDSLSHVG